MKIRQLYLDRIIPAMDTEFIKIIDYEQLG